jgi:hypothetical protein
VLQPCVVREVHDSGWELAFEDRHRAVETGEEKLVYYERSRDFIQQLVLVKAQSSDGPPFVIGVKPVGDAISVGTRREDRVSTRGAGLTAMLDDEDSCLIQDVSLSGLSIISTRRYHVGRCLEIAIRYEDAEYVGPAEIQYANPLDGGEARYGFLGVFDTAEGKNLQNGLTRMTLGIQQQQLRRSTSTS